MNPHVSIVAVTPAGQPMTEAELDVLADGDGLHPDCAWVEPFINVKLPKGWLRDSVQLDGARFVGPGHTSVIISGAVEDDGLRWLHASIGRKAYIPTWSDLTFLRTTFIGTALYCCMVFPPAHFYVNLNPHVLHLWACADGWPLPEFSGKIHGVRTI